MKGDRSKAVTLWVFVAVALVMLSAPTLVVLGASFTAGNMITFPPEGLSLKWYAKIAGATDLRDAFLRSLIVATICTAVAIPAGTLAGMGAPAFACTPDQFPDLMAAAVARRDLAQWAAARGIVTAGRAAGGS